MGGKWCVAVPTKRIPLFACEISDRSLRWKVPSDPGSDFSTNNADAGGQPDALQSSASAKDRIKDREKEKQPSPLEETQPSDDQHSLKKEVNTVSVWSTDPQPVSTLLRYNTCSKFNAHRWPVLHARQQITKKA
ncbi:hypothetical protein [Acidithiobacillus sp.]|uniref:hypothetical protein n=1 Tax=Acidithiobacillus sp. TaxID=1872118 RepID=UPI00258E7185|nr:hypothetical protein [Acidithiobacillus sp.]MDD5375927.1 hypothetical protein [Acidithiobacillus sp.]